MEIESANCKYRVSECEDIEQLSVDYPVKCEREIDGLETLVQELHRVFSKSHVNIQEVQSLMSAYKSDPKQWRKFAKFDRFRYTRNLVDAGNGLFNIMILCWGPGHASAIHDHADSHCFMKLLSGSLDEVRYEWPNNVEPEVVKKLKTKSNRRTPSETEEITENIMKLDMNENDRCHNGGQNGQDGRQNGQDGRQNGQVGRQNAQDGRQNGHNDDDCGYDAKSMKEIGRTRLEIDDVCYINDAQGLHRMENPSHVDGAVSLHLYCPPFDSCRVFDSRTGKSTEVKVTFWSMYGKKIKRVIEATPSDDQD